MKSFSVKAKQHEDVTAAHLFSYRYAVIESLVVSHSVALPPSELKQ